MEYNWNGTLRRHNSDVVEQQPSFGITRRSYVSSAVNMSRARISETSYVRVCVLVVRDSV